MSPEATLEMLGTEGQRGTGEEAQRGRGAEGQGVGPGSPSLPPRPPHPLLLHPNLQGALVPLPVLHKESQHQV